MDYEIIFAASGEADLEDAISSVNQRDPQAAAQLRLDLLQCIDQLRANPRLGAVYKRKRGREFRELLCVYYRVYYTVNDQAQQVEVVRVWHTSRHDPRLPG